MKKVFVAWHIGVLLLAVTGSVLANPVTTIGTSAPDPCDNLGLAPRGYEQLGTTVDFPADERISATSVASPNVAACKTHVATASVTVAITNDTAETWKHLYYVAQPGTTIGNVDLLINGQQAFAIDAVGNNIPFISEVGGSIDGAFEPGEIWTFIVENYVNLYSLSVTAMSGLGIPNNSQTASGSILAFNCVPDDCCEWNIECPVPEPANVALIGLGLGVLIWSRRLRPKNRF